MFVLSGSEHDVRPTTPLISTCSYRGCGVVRTSTSSTSSAIFCHLRHRMPWARKTTHGFDQLLAHFFLILNIASIKLTCTRGLGDVGEFRYLIGLAAPAAPRRAAPRREFKPGSQYVAQLRGAARRGAALATICEHSTAHESRRAAPRREDRPEFYKAWFTIRRTATRRGTARRDAPRRAARRAPRPCSQCLS